MEHRGTGSIEKKTSRIKANPVGDVGTIIWWRGGNIEDAAMKMGAATFGAASSHNQDSKCP